MSSESVTDEDVYKRISSTVKKDQNRRYNMQCVALLLWNTVETQHTEWRQSRNPANEKHNTDRHHHFSDPSVNFHSSLVKKW